MHRAGKQAGINRLPYSSGRTTWATSRTQSLQDAVMALGNRIVAQSAEMGALSTLYVAAAPDVAGGAYYGPDGATQQRGYPCRVGSSRAYRDEAVAARLWDLSEHLTGVTMPRG